MNYLFQTRIVRDVFEGSAKQTVGMATISQPQIKVDGFVKTILPSFLDALPRDELLPEG